MTTTNALVTTKTNELPSIRNRAILVNLTFHKPQLTKLDTKVTREAEAKHSASGALKTQRQLYPKAMLAPILAIESEARAHLRNNGVEWGTPGMYLIDTEVYLEVRMKLTDYEKERQQAVVKFAQDWTNVLVKAQQQQGDLYDPSVYPDVADVTSQFTMKLYVAPLGTYVPTMFTNIEEELREQITEDVEAATQSALLSAVGQPLKRLFGAVLNIYDKTSRDKSRLHESLMDDLEAAVTLMPALNIMDIPELDDLATRCSTTLQRDLSTLKGKDNPARAGVADGAKGILLSAGIDPTDLFKVDTDGARKELAEKATDNIMSKMEGFF